MAWIRPLKTTVLIRSSEVESKISRKVRSDLGYDALVELPDLR
jgi:hypothetical protein